jgi:hypothetical protein
MESRLRSGEWSVSFKMVRQDQLTLPPDQFSLLFQPSLEDLEMTGGERPEQSWEGSAVCRAVLGRREQRETERGTERETAAAPNMTNELMLPGNSSSSSIDDNGYFQFVMNLLDETEANPAWKREIEESMGLHDDCTQSNLISSHSPQFCQFTQNLHCETGPSVGISALKTKSMPRLERGPTRSSSLIRLILKLWSQCTRSKIFVLIETQWRLCNWRVEVEQRL